MNTLSLLHLLGLLPWQQMQKAWRFACLFIVSKPRNSAINYGSCQTENSNVVSDEEHPCNLRDASLPPAIRESRTSLMPVSMWSSWRESSTTRYVRCRLCECATLLLTCHSPLASFVCVLVRYHWPSNSTARLVKLFKERELHQLEGRRLPWRSLLWPIPVFVGPDWIECSSTRSRLAAVWQPRQDIVAEEKDWFTYTRWWLTLLLYAVAMHNASRDTMHLPP